MHGLHVSKWPVMLPNANGDGALESLVTVMGWLVYDVNKRWGDALLSRCVHAMT